MAEAAFGVNYAPAGATPSIAIARAITPQVRIISPVSVGNLQARFLRRFTTIPEATRQLRRF
jgi:hypothetical protein